jgi:Fic family protein
MKMPPFDLTPKILVLVANIQSLLGELHGHAIQIKPSPQLRKENKIKTVHHSLAIEGNTLSEKKVTALLENKRVIGPQAQIREVTNALELYYQISKLKPAIEKAFLNAHKVLMKGLIENAGKYRPTAVGILKGMKVSRMAPPAKQVPRLMGDLFDFLKNEKETHLLIKACVFHYELEFIHPFLDGNGRMGRLWQQRILMEHSPVFEFLAVETWIHREQKKYYSALEKSDQQGSSTVFIEFSLDLILNELKSFREQFKPTRKSIDDRIDEAIKHFGLKSFSRKAYQALHKGISAPTASRDLARAVSLGKLLVEGTKATASYQAKSV